MSFLFKAYQGCCKVERVPQIVFLLFIITQSYSHAERYKCSKALMQARALLDMNSDLEISKEETACVEANMRAQIKLKDPYEKLLAFDVTRDGYIGTNPENRWESDWDMLAVIRAGLHDCPRVYLRAFTAIDANKDGVIQKHEFERFYNRVLDNINGNKPFDSLLDIDGNGTINAMDALNLVNTRNAYAQLPRWSLW